MRVQEPLRYWFLPDHLTGDDSLSRQALRTVKIALAMLLWVPVFIIVYEYVDAPISAAVLGVAGAAVLVVLRSLRWGAPVRAVANAVTGLVCLTLVAISAATGGFDAPAFRWLAVVPLLGILLGGRVSGLVWTAVSLLSGTVFVLIRNHHGKLPSELTQDTLTLVSTCGDLGMISCVAIVTWLFDRSERSAQSMLLQARYAAEAATRAKSSFLANMSHELRTPMNGILGMTNLTLKTPLTRSQRDYLQTVKSSADSLLRIVDDILDFSKVEAGRLTFDQTDFKVADCISEAIQMVASQARSKGLAVSCSIADGVPTIVSGDPFRLRQVLLNLLCNAVKFTEQRRIDVTAETVPSENDAVEIRFRVTDTGVGIPGDKLESIFEAFVQADTSTTRTHGGTGLGLTISAELVELMGGRLQVSSTPGAGSCFEFTATFVRASDPDDSGATREAGRHSLPTGVDGHDLHQVSPACDDTLICRNPVDPTVRPRALRRLRVLVADDNPINQRLAEVVLQQAGYDVTLVPNGQEAINRVAAEQFDVLLMDLSMPKVDGLTATSAIRAQESGSVRRLPIVALTANSSREDRDRCTAAGMDGFLVKPLDPAALTEEILRHCPAPAIRD